MIKQVVIRSENPASDAQYAASIPLTHATFILNKIALVNYGLLFISLLLYTKVSPWIFAACVASAMINISIMDMLYSAWKRRLIERHTKILAKQTVTADEDGLHVENFDGQSKRFYSYDMFKKAYAANGRVTLRGMDDIADISIPQGASEERSELNHLIAKRVELVSVDAELFKWTKGRPKDFEAGRRVRIVIFLILLGLVISNIGKWPLQKVPGLKAEARMEEVAKQADNRP